MILTVPATHTASTIIALSTNAQIKMQKCISAAVKSTLYRPMKSSCGSRSLSIYLNHITTCSRFDESVTSSAIKAYYGVDLMELPISLSIRNLILYLRTRVFICFLLHILQYHWIVNAWQHQKLREIAVRFILISTHSYALPR